MNRGRPRKYRFDLLRPGEHFDVALRSSGHRTSVASAACYYGRMHGQRFETRMVSIGGDLANMRSTNSRYANAVRVTRIA